MRRFGGATLFRSPSTFQKLKFFLFGYEFIGAHIRLGHFKKALAALKKEINKNQNNDGKKEYSVLDAGCGAGDFSFYLAERNPSWNIFSYDIKESILQENKEIQRKMKIKNITFSCSDLLQLSEKDNYDFIFSIGTLIYFSKKETEHILLNITKTLKKGGYLYLDLPQEDFLEIQFIPQYFYPEFYAALKKENSGDLYSFNDIKGILVNMGYTIIFSNKSFSYPGKLAWELDNGLKEKQLFRLRYFFLPFLKTLAGLDGITKHKKGCCFVILARKT